MAFHSLSPLCCTTPCICRHWDLDRSSVSGSRRFEHWDFSQTMSTPRRYFPTWRPTLCACVNGWTRSPVAAPRGERLGGRYGTCAELSAGNLWVRHVRNRVQQLLGATPRRAESALARQNPHSRLRASCRGPTVCWHAHTRSLYHHHELILPRICFESAWFAQARNTRCLQSSPIKNLPSKPILQTHVSMRLLIGRST